MGKHKREERREKKNERGREKRKEEWQRKEEENGDYYQGVLRSHAHDPL
jgi:hypothetical protein